MLFALDVAMESIKIDWIAVNAQLIENMLSMCVII